MAELTRTCVFILITLVGGAQAQDALLKTAFQDKTLVLRGFPEYRSIKFDKSGTPHKSYKPWSWTLSGFEIKKVTMDRQRLRLEGDGVGFVYDAAQKRLVIVNLKIHRTVTVEDLPSPFPDEKSVDDLKYKIFYRNSLELAADSPPRRKAGMGLYA